MRDQQQVEEHRHQHQRHVDASRARLIAAIEPTRALAVEQLASDERAVRIGHRLYLDNCAACHGSKALGNHAIGAPDLTDAEWLYGGSGKEIMVSILDGRTGVMPPLEGVLGFQGVNEVASYVLSLSGVQAPADWVAAGKPRFDGLCAACHGVDAVGNVGLGAPSLVDGAWLYGSDFATVVTSIGKGRSGVMPGWRSRLNEDEARVIAAWVIAQGRRETAAK